MKEEILIEFYNEYFNGVIPRTTDGRVRDFLNDILPFYLRNLAKQEMVSLGHTITGVGDRFNLGTEAEIAYIVSCLKNEMYLTPEARCQARVRRTIEFNGDDINEEQFDHLVQEELQTKEFNMLSYMLDYYRKQLDGYYEICSRYGICVPKNDSEELEDIGIKLKNK
jgi:hypothetical protein